MQQNIKFFAYMKSNTMSILMKDPNINFNDRDYEDIYAEFFAERGI